MDLREKIQQIKDYLRGRSAAYRRVFNKESQDAKIVLADLGRFCRAFQSTGHQDPYMAARLDGRREVWLRIMEHQNLSTDELYDLYSKTQIKGN